MVISKQLEALAAIISAASGAAPLTLAILFFGLVSVILAYKKR